MFFRKKPNIGYKKIKKDKTGRRKERKFLSSLVIPFGKKIPLKERFLKFIIYIGLKIVIRPKKWKYPEKNLKIINITYKKMVSSDFSFIPSSIAFYFVLAFLPMLTIIIFISIAIGTESIIGSNRSYLIEVFENFIPGSHEIISSLVSLNELNFGEATFVTISALSTLIASSWIAGAGFSKLIYTQSHLYNQKHSGNFLVDRIKGIFTIFGGSLFLTIVLAINIYIVKWTKTLDLSKGNQSLVARLILYLSLFLLVFLLYVAIFKITPRYAIKIRHVIPGAMVAAIPTALFISLFGFISNKIWSYKSYGPVGSIMYIGMASLIMSYFLFVGLITNVSYYQTFVPETLKKKKTFLKSNFVK